MQKLLIALSLLMMVAAPALANMEGCSAELLAPVSADPGDIVTFEFYFENGSPDGELTNVVVIRFPETISILEAWYDDGDYDWDFAIEISGEFSNTAYFRNDLGQIAPGTGGKFYTQAQIKPNMDCGTFEIRAKQYGDRTGAPAHWFGEHIEFTLCWLPSETSSWSVVKSLY